MRLNLHMLLQITLARMITLSAQPTYVRTFSQLQQDLDHNPTFHTARSSLNGTGISIFQFPSSQKPGTGKEGLQFDPSNTDSRGGDLAEFFRHESSLYPSALSCEGSLILCTKSDLLECIANTNKEELIAPETCDFVILDGGVLIHTLPGTAVQGKTYEVLKYV